VKRLLSPEGDAALREHLRGRALLAFDFDGTLAPIVDRPGDARVPEQVARRLRRLAERLVVAVLTGREIADVRGRLGFTPAHVVGSHGAEDPARGETIGFVRELDASRDRLRRFDERLRAAGVLVEDKSASIALHYRLAPDREAATALIDEVLSELGPGVRRFGGKMVSNLVAAAASDKAGALEALVARCAVERVVFVGDDVNDEPVFVHGGGRWLTVRVGADGPRSKACFCLEGIGEFPEMLDRMLAASEGG
jgi:trehalose 6-phosphate phosphatase